MATALKDWEFPAEERVSGIYPRALPALTPSHVLAELREITGKETVAVLLFPTAGKAPDAASYPTLPRRLEQSYPLTHRLTSWVHGVARSCVVDVPAYLTAWFPHDRVVVVPISTPEWEAGVLVVTRACAKRAMEIRSLAADLALRLEREDRRSRIEVLGLELREQA